METRITSPYWRRRTSRIRRAVVAINTVVTRALAHAAFIGMLVTGLVVGLALYMWRVADAPVLMSHVDRVNYEDAATVLTMIGLLAVYATVHLTMTTTIQMIRRR